MSWLKRVLNAIFGRISVSALTTDLPVDACQSPVTWWAPIICAPPAASDAHTQV